MALNIPSPLSPSHCDTISPATNGTPGSAAKDTVGSGQQSGGPWLGRVVCLQGAGTGGVCRRWQLWWYLVSVEPRSQHRCGQECAWACSAVGTLWKEQAVLKGRVSFQVWHLAIFCVQVECWTVCSSSRTFGIRGGRCGQGPCRLPVPMGIPWREECSGEGRVARSLADYQSLWVSE